METIAGNHELGNLYHESLDQQRDIKSVRSSASVLYVRADHFALCSAVIHEFTNNDKRIYEMYDKFGPTPHICFDLLHNEDQLVLYEDHYNCALEGLSLETFRKMISETKTLSMDDLSDTLLLVKRMPKEELRRENLRDSDEASWVSKSVEPITHAVEVAFRVQLWKQSRAEQLQLYCYLANVAGMRRFAGLVFESLAQSKLQDKIKLALVPMVRKESGGSGQVKKSRPNGTPTTE